MDLLKYSFIAMSSIAFICSGIVFEVTVRLSNRTSIFLGLFTGLVLFSASLIYYWVYKHV